MGMYLSNGALTLLLTNRWIVSGHFPLSNLYESLLFLSWSFTTIYTIASLVLSSVLLPTLGSSVAPITLLTCGFAFFCVPQELQGASPLVPALQSNWLVMHVTVMILSYASLLVGSLLALTLLVTKTPNSSSLSTTALNTTSVESAYFASNGSLLLNKDIALLKDRVLETSSTITKRDAFISEKTNSILKNIYPHKVDSVFHKDGPYSLLDNMSYRFIGLGFALLTLGIVSGAVWANFAWGSYWSWDPKETWALITWLTYASYLHLRISKGWQGKPSAMVAILGFFVVWFCYLGVNLFGKGLHSYAFV